MFGHINFFSLNIGTSSSLAGLQALIDSENLDIIFLQEVRLSSDQIKSLLSGFDAVANIDPEFPSRPGTAIIWRENIPLTDVCPLVMCRLQVAKLKGLNLINIYAPSGSDKRGEREIFYGEEMAYITCIIYLIEKETSSEK